MFNKHDIRRNACQLFGAQAKRGYDWWWHSFTGVSDETGRERQFFLEFFLCNPALGGAEPVFGQLPENRATGKRPSYLMVKAGTWGTGGGQLHRFFGWEEADVGWGVPFHVGASDCRLDERETRGSVSVSPEEAAAHPEWMCGSGTMEWELRMDKLTAFNVGYGASAPMRRLQLFEMFWHAEGMKTLYEGWVRWNGERFAVKRETSFGYQDKNWGKDFTTPWVWLASSCLTSEVTGQRLADSAFDIGGGRPKVGPVALNRKLLSAFWYEGRGYEFNFSKFWTFTRTSFNCYETETELRWHVEQRNLFDRMVTDITCPKTELLLVNYEAPDGAKRHTRLWNGGNGRGTVLLYHRGKLVDRIRAEKVGCEYGEYDAAEPYRSALAQSAHS